MLRRAAATTCCDARRARCDHRRCGARRHARPRSRSARHVPPNEAPHFTAFVVEQLPPRVRRAGGTRAHDARSPAAAHAAAPRHRAGRDRSPRHDLQQAGVVVLDDRDLRDARDGRLDGLGVVRAVRSTSRPAAAIPARRSSRSSTRRQHRARRVAGDHRVGHPRRRASSTARRTAPEHGPVRYREALASSYNFAAIDVLEQVGIERVMIVAPPGRRRVSRRITRTTTGSRLALGAPKVRLRRSRGELRLRRQGRSRRHAASDRIRDATGWLALDAAHACPSAASSRPPRRG